MTLENPTLSLGFPWTMEEVNLILGYGSVTHCLLICYLVNGWSSSRAQTSLDVLFYWNHSCSHRALFWQKSLTFCFENLSSLLKDCQHSSIVNTLSNFSCIPLFLFRGRISLHIFYSFTQNTPVPIFKYQVYLLIYP